MDTTALFSMNYGLYIVAASFEGKDAGCVVNTLTQVTNSPNRLTVAINKENFTTEIIERSGHFAATVLTVETDMNLIRKFGFGTSRDRDKFDSQPADRDSAGAPYLTEHMAARFSCDILSSLDAGTHIIFLGQLTEAQCMSGEEAMTYGYYHTVKNGLTPPKASGYQPKAKS